MNFACVAVHIHLLSPPHAPPPSAPARRAARVPAAERLLTPAVQPTVATANRTGGRPISNWRSAEHRVRRLEAPRHVVQALPPRRSASAGQSRASFNYRPALAP